MGRRLDFFARRVHFVDHLAPIWRCLGADVRGVFWVPEALVDYAGMRGVAAAGLRPVRRQMPVMEVWPERSTSPNPVLCCAYHDMEQVWKSDRRRPLFLMEHGVGLTPGVSVDGTERLHPGYAGGLGLREKVALFLAPNGFIAGKTQRAIPSAKQVVIGTPKMDPWAPGAQGGPMLDAVAPGAQGSEQNAELQCAGGTLAPQLLQEQDLQCAGGTPAPQLLQLRQGPPVVAVSFHWDGSRVCPEAGNAWPYFRHGLPALAERYTVLGHGHPKGLFRFRRDYDALGIEVVEDFEEVLARADCYVNDCSSTMYEFACVDRPVVVCNAPWFRRDVDYGIRFWRWSDVGVECNGPGTLADSVALALEDRADQAAKRRGAVVDLYPYLGESAARAGKILTAVMSDE